MWSRDGRLLHDVSHGRLLAAQIDESTGVRVTRQDTLFSLATAWGRFTVTEPPSAGSSPGLYDVFPNGDLVMLASGAAADSMRANIIATLHWYKAPIR